MTTLDPQAIYERGLENLSNLHGVERLVYLLQDFENLVDREGWDHFFVYAHHFRMYAELKEWLGAIRADESLAVLADYENHLERHGVALSPEEIGDFLSAQLDQCGGLSGCPGLSARYNADAMTEAEQRAAEEELIRFQEENPDVWGDQDENGVDLTRLRENLQLTPAERLAKHEVARHLAREFKEAGERYRAAQRNRSRLPAG